MSEYRQDPLTGRWVIIAENRAARPDEFPPPPPVRKAGHCPFCAGSESETPEPVAVYPPVSGERRDWQTRVVPNKFPALTAGSGQDESRDALDAELFQRHPAIGRHEVVIEAPSHLVSFSELDDQQAQFAFAAYRDRLRALSQIDDLRHSVVIKNCGAAAGASIEHVHSQIIATSKTPVAVQQKLDRARLYFQQREQNLFVEMAAAERRTKRRIVAETDGFLAFCPFASRTPFETWVLPKEAASRFESTGDARLNELALLVRGIVQSLETELQRPAYNFVIETAPFDTRPLDHYYWHMEIFPRQTRLAGFEWSTGCYINPVSPEESAQRLAAVFPGVHGG